LKKKILVIDDEIDLTKVLKKRLTNAGYAVVTLNDSREALDTIREEKPDLILLDIMMPYKDGYEICDEARCYDETKHIPIIVFTAKPLEKDFIKDIHSLFGATDYLLKPFKTEDLLEKIAKHIKGKI